MWIQTRTASPSRCAETASSKSRAVAGSTVKVVERGQVAARQRALLRPLGRPPRFVLERGLEAAPAELLAQQRLDGVASVLRRCATAGAAPAAHSPLSFVFRVGEDPEGAVDRLVALGPGHVAGLHVGLDPVAGEVRRRPG